MSSNPSPSPERSGPGSSPLQRGRDLALPVFLVVATLANYWAHRHFYFEDAFITFRYADHLGRGLGMVFNPGERVLGASSALYTLLLGALAALGLDVVQAGGLIYCTCLSAAGYLVARYLARMGYANAGVIFALLAAWGVGGTYRFFGMETALYLLLIVASAIRASRDGERLAAGEAVNPWPLGILLGLTCLTRYDGMVVAFVIGMYLWLRHPGTPWKRPPWAVACICSSLFGLWLVVAWAYFGSPLPNTLGAKAGDSSLWDYLVASWKDLSIALFSPVLYRVENPLPPWFRGLRPWLLGLLVLPTFWASRRLLFRHRDVFMWPAIALLLLLGYATIGPPKEHHWYQIPSLYALLAFFLASWGEAFRRLGSRFTSIHLWATGGALAAILVSLVAIPWTVPREGHRHITTGPPGRIASYTQFVRWIVERNLSDTSVLTHEPGFLTFYTGQRAIDAAGLVSRDIYFHGPKERRSNLFQLIDRFEPDFLVLKQQRMWVDPRLDRTYLKVSNGMPNLTLFMRRELYGQRAEDMQAPWLERSEDSAVDIPLPDLVSPESVTTAQGWQLLGRPFDNAEGIGMAWTAPWPVDFDEVQLEFSAGSQETRLQLLVDNAVVWELDHRGRGPGLQPVTLSLTPWWGRQARLRLVDGDDRAATHLANLRMVGFTSKERLTDFEGEQAADFWQPAHPADSTGDIVAEETAPHALIQSNQNLGLRFGFQRTQGLQAASTLGAAAPLRRFSRPFLLTEDRLQCLLYDLGGPETSLSLWVQGERVRHFKGNGSGQARMLRWGVKDWRGQEAVLQLRDMDGKADAGLALDACLLYSP